VGGACGITGEGRNVYKILLREPEGKTLVPLGRQRRTWEDGIRMDVREIGCGYGVDSVGSGPVAGFCKQGDEPSVSVATELVS
jgi:hypothetical protein